MSEPIEIPEARSARMKMWSNCTPRETEIIIGEACIAYAARVGTELKLLVADRMEWQDVALKNQARAEKAEAELAELKEDLARVIRSRDDYKKVLENRECALKEAGARWVKAMAERDELAKLRADVKPLLEFLNQLPVGQIKANYFLSLHPELKDV